jgi:IclR family transcriptional regulator, KDG regulon repressor
MAKKTGRAKKTASTARSLKAVDKNFIGLTSKIFAVLEALGRGGSNPLSLEDVTKSVKLAKTTVHRLLYSLGKIGYVERYEDTGKYALMGKFFEIGRNALPHRHLTSLARPLMKTLVNRFGVSVHLGVLEQGQVVYVTVEQSQSPFRCAATVGDCCYCHSTSIGKSMLAHMPEEELSSIIAQHGLPPMTSRTLTTREALDKELKNVRDVGFAVDRGENIEGVICIGAPIFDRAGHVLAAISASAPSGQIERQFDSLQQELRRVTGKLSMMVGYSPGVSGTGATR